MPLKIVYMGNETTVEDDATVLIGSDAASAIRIARPGISRKHAVVSFDGKTWKVEDAGSRNGIFADGERVHTSVIDGPTTLYLGHPKEGEAISFVVLSDNPPDTKEASEPSIQDEIDSFVAAPKPTQKTRSTPPVAEPPEKTRVQPVTTAAASDAELAALTAALRDQINTVKGLTWSVWAMIAVTAALSVMTLFVGVLGN